MEWEHLERGRSGQVISADICEGHAISFDAGAVMLWLAEEVAPAVELLPVGGS